MKKLLFLFALLLLLSGCESFATDKTESPPGQVIMQSLPSSDIDTYTYQLTENATESATITAPAADPISYFCTVVNQPGATLRYVSPYNFRSGDVFRVSGINYLVIRVEGAPPGGQDNCTALIYKL